MNILTNLYRFPPGKNDMEQDKTKMELPLDMVISISASICRTIILRTKKQFRDDDAICRFMSNGKHASELYYRGGCVQY